jgi:hypothetical protein
MRLILKITVITMFFSLFLAACNMPTPTPNAAATIQAVYTAQAVTTQTGQNLSGATATPGIMPTIVFPTLPAATVLPSPTPIPPTPQKPVTYCDWATYIDDVTVPDGTVFAPGAQFTKTWRLKNIGTCSWTSAYALVFSNGNNMSGAAATSVLNGNVNPGQTVDISINLTAPAAEGNYRGYYLLRNGAGVLFGLGPSDKDPFYVDIKVAGSMTRVFDFATSYCSAAWNSGAGNLGCTTSGSNKGYATKVDNPQLENGQTYNGPGLLTVPENTKNGYLQGYYPAFTVQKGDRFRAIINCAYLANGCDGIFRLDYQINSEPVKTIWQFDEKYEGEYYTVDTDLSPLAGNQVKFVLTILSSGSAENDRMLWVGPRIDRPSNLVTPSPVPTATGTPTATVVPTAYP